MTRKTTITRRERPDDERTPVARWSHVVTRVADADLDEHRRFRIKADPMRRSVRVVNHSDDFVYVVFGDEAALENAVFLAGRRYPTNTIAINNAPGELFLCSPFNTVCDVEVQEIYLEADAPPLDPRPLEPTPS